MEPIVLAERDRHVQGLAKDRGRLFLVSRAGRREDAYYRHGLDCAVPLATGASDGFHVELRNLAAVEVVPAAHHSGVGEHDIA